MIKKIILTFAFLLLIFIPSYAEEGLMLTEWKMQLSTSTPDSMLSSSWTNVRLPYTRYSETQANSMWLEKEITIPSDTKKRYYLDFNGLNCDAIVFIKKQSSSDFVKIGEVMGPYGSIDITGGIEAGKEAVLRIWVTNWWIGTQNRRETNFFRNAAIALYAKTFSYTDNDFRTNLLLGIKESICLRTENEAMEIENVFIETSVRTKKINLTIDSKRWGNTAKFRISIDNTNIDKRIFPCENDTENINIAWDDPVLWEVSAPYLYYLTVEMLDESNNILDTQKIRFGFREVWRDGKNLYFNGHPLRMRLAPFVTGGTRVMEFYSGIGFNTMLIQPNQTHWWSAKRNGLFPSISKDKLDYADENGWLVLMPAPTVHNVSGSLSNQDVLEEYNRYLKMFLKDVQNRPSIISWTPNMNEGSNQFDPLKIGQQKADTRLVETVIKAADPTRLVYYHNGGSSGDIETLNFYTNHMNIQEVEEFLAPWSANGILPWGVSEFGVGFPSDFFNNGNMLPQFTEFLARYYGDAAYEKQTLKYQNIINEMLASIDPSKVTTAFTGQDYFQSKGYYNTLHNHTLIGKFYEDYTKRIYRAWRTHGINYGMFPFSEFGFGMPDESYSSKNYEWLDSYDKTMDLTKKPDWANLYYDQFKDVSQPFLAYIGGNSDNFTEKSHNFESGETVKKSIIAIWDGPYSKNIDIELSVICGENEIKKIEKNLTLNAGDIYLEEVTFQSPDISEKLTGNIILTVKENGSIILTDTFNLTFFPKKVKYNITKNWGIYDPLGLTTAELRGYPLKSINKNDDISELDVLIIGYNALEDNDYIPYTNEDLKNGLKVLYMEQGLSGLEKLGFRANDLIARDAFIRISEHMAVEGIEDKDLSHFRGAGELLPAADLGMREWTERRAPHYNNTGSVASVLIETPQTSAFTPIVEAEYDLQYSPLLSFKHGKGEILFCQIDLHTRINKEPAADLLLNNIFKYFDTKSDNNQIKKIVYMGSSKGDIEYLQALDFNFSRYNGILDVNKDILVVGELLKNDAEIMDFAENGGVTVILPQWQKNLTGFFDVNQLINVNISSVKPSEIENNSLFTGMGAQLFNFRKNLNLTGFENGLLNGMIYEKVFDNNGKIIFSQVDWRKLCENENTKSRVVNIQQPKLNMYRFYKQLFTNLGVQTSDAAAEYLSMAN